MRGPVTIRKATRGHKQDCVCFRCVKTFKNGQPAPKRLSPQALSFITGVAARSDSHGQRDRVAENYDSVRRAVMQGQKKRAERGKRGTSKLSDDDVRAMYDLYENAGWTWQMVAAVWTCVERHHVRQILVQGVRSPKPLTR